jgi:hypothetical protein
MVGGPLSTAIVVVKVVSMGQILPENILIFAKRFKKVKLWP